MTTTSDRWSTAPVNFLNYSVLSFHQKKGFVLIEHSPGIQLSPANCVGTLSCTHRTNCEPVVAQTRPDWARFRSFGSEWIYAENQLQLAKLRPALGQRWHPESDVSFPPTFLPSTPRSLKTPSIPYFHFLQSLSHLSLLLLHFPIWLNVLLKLLMK